MNLSNLYKFKSTDKILIEVLEKRFIGKNEIIDNVNSK